MAPCGFLILHLKKNLDFMMGKLNTLQQAVVESQKMSELLKKH
jgi:hypothetical protein